jgi:hypothetical protein
MRRDAAVEAWLVPVAVDSVVQGLLGPEPEFDMAGEQDYAVPSIEYSLISPAVLFGEVYWRTLIQLDMWLYTLAELNSLEGALVRLLQFDTPVDIGTIPMWSEMQEGGVALAGARDGVFGRSMDFHLTYLRGMYTP